MAQFNIRTGVLLARDTLGTQKVVCGFRPKAIAMVSVAEALELPNQSVNVISGSFGFSDGVTSKTMAHYTLTFGEIYAARRVSLTPNCIYFSIDSNGAVRQRAEVTSFDVDGFTINWTNVTAGSNTAIVFLAVGGDAVSAKVVEWATSGSTGVQSVANVGFQPDFIFHLTQYLTNNLAVATDHAVHTVGMQSRLGEQAVVGSSSQADHVSAFTTNTKHWISNSDCILCYNPATGAVAYAAAHSAMQVDGFDVNWSTALANQRMFSLCIKGLDPKILFQRKVSTTTPNTLQSFTGFGFQPQGVLAMWAPESIAANYTTGRMIRDNWDMEMGVFDQTTQAAGYGIHDDAGAAAAYAYIDLKALIVSGGAAAPSTRSKAVWNAWGADGFTVKWETSQATAPMLFLAAFAQKNVAPFAPATSSAAFASVTSAFPLNWVFSDPDVGNTQGSYEVEIEVETAPGSGVFTSFVDTGKVAGSVQVYNVTANTMTTGTLYRWRVRTWDNKDLVGPFSNYRTYRTTPAPTVAITTPGSDGAWGSDTASIDWSFSDPDGEPQKDRQVRVVRLSDSVEVLNTGKVATTDQAYTITGLANGTNYRVFVRVWNSLDVQSDTEAQRVLNVSYNPPMTPTPITFTPQASSGRIKIDITIPATGGSNQDTKIVMLYRDQTLIAKWTKLTGGFAGATVLTHYDYEARSGVLESYRLVSYSTLGTMVEVTGLSSTLTLTGIWIHKISDPQATAVMLQTVESRTWTEVPERTLTQVAGREAPLVEWGEHVDRRVEMDTALLDRNGQRALIYGYAISKATMCYRDLKGRRLKGVFGEYTGTAEIWGERAPLVIDEVSVDNVPASYQTA